MAQQPPFPESQRIERIICPSAATSQGVAYVPIPPKRKRARSSTRSDISKRARFSGHPARIESEYNNKQDNHTNSHVQMPKHTDNDEEDILESLELLFDENREQDRLNAAAQRGRRNAFSGSVEDLSSLVDADVLAEHIASMQLLHVNIATVPAVWPINGPGDPAQNGIAALRRYNLRTTMASTRHRLQIAPVEPVKTKADESKSATSDDSNDDGSDDSDFVGPKEVRTDDDSKDVDGNDPKPKEKGSKKYKAEKSASKNSKVQKSTVKNETTKKSASKNNTTKKPATKDNKVEKTAPEDKVEHTKADAEQFHDCIVCGDNVAADDIGSLEACLHSTQICKPCWSNWVAASIDLGNWNNLTCPEENCKSQMEHTDLQRLVTAEVFERYDQLALRAACNALGQWSTTI